MYFVRRVLSAGCAIVLLASAVRADDWPQFRGPNRDGISAETGLLREWPADGPKVHWTTSVCEGFSAPAVVNGRVYFNDYDRKTSKWMVRCVTLDEGKELWRYGYRRPIRSNHLITRTVPAVDGKYVFSLDPKCVFHCLDAKTGKEIWQKNLPPLYATKIPPWYAGQCPLIEEDRVIISPGGKARMAAYEKATGNVIWETPDEERTIMSHSSVMPTEIDGVRQYVHCNLQGAVGVGEDGKLQWSFPWKFNLAVAVSALPIGDGRIFLTNCYDAETVMLRVTRNGDSFSAEKVFSLGSRGWNSEVHTPIIFEDHLFGIGKKDRGQFTCLDLNGRQVWDSNRKTSYDLGSYILADGMFFVLEGKTGMLRLLEANVNEYKELAHAKVLAGPEVWAPLALSDGKLLVRDTAVMKCLQVKAP